MSQTHATGTLARALSARCATPETAPALHRSWCLGLVLLLTRTGGSPREAVAQDTRAAFDRFFTDRTMRVDYFHTSRTNERIVTLDRVLDDGGWAGSRTRRLDDTNLGQDFSEVSDRKRRSSVGRNSVSTRSI